MKIRETVLEVREDYVADDGRVFRDKEDCEIYEQFAPSTLYDILKDYCSFDDKMAKSLKNNRFAKDSSMIIHTSIPRDKRRYCILINKDEEGCPNITDHEKPTLFFNELDPMGYRIDHWIKIGSEDYCKKEIEYYKKMLIKFQNLK